MQNTFILPNNNVINKTIQPKSTFNGIIHKKLSSINRCSLIHNYKFISNQDILLNNRNNFIVACKPTKASEFRDMTFDEIDAAVIECKKELYFLRAKLATRQDYKPHMYK